MGNTINSIAQVLECYSSLGWTF